MYSNPIRWSIASLLLFVAVMTAVGHHGSSNRIFAPEEAAITVGSPEEAYQIWQEKKVRGRILLLFDNYPHARGLANYENGPALSHSNLVEFSIFKNVVRKVYLVVKDEEWESFRAQKEMRPLRPVDGIEKALFLYYKSGVPVIAITPSSLHPLGEAVLIYINESFFDSSQVLDLVAAKRIESDLIVRFEGRSK